MSHMNKEKKRYTTSAIPETGDSPEVSVPAAARPPFSRKKIGILVAVVCLLAAAVAVILILTGEPRVKSAEDAASLLADHAEELGYANALSELTELHTHTVEGHNYYRLQQNYHGMPVYGRTVVCTTDSRGDLLSVTQNICDVPEDLNLTPSITADQATDAIKAYLAENDPEQDWSRDFGASLDEDSLRVYISDETARLVYEISWNTAVFILDAHTAQVLNFYDTIRTARASFANSGETLDVLKLEDGTYVLKDENTGTFVFSAQDRSFYDPSAKFDKTNSSALQIITSPDHVFGDGNDSISDPESITKAGNLLNSVNEIRGFYESNIGKLPFDNLVLVYDDHINDSQNGGICGGGWTKVSNVFGFGKDLSDYEPGNHAKETGLISVGTFYSNYAVSPDMIQVDVLAHEYTHIVTGCIVDWTQGNDENEALDEAYSDIFGELFEVYKRGSVYWRNSGRNITDPAQTNNATVAGENGLIGPFPSLNGTDNFRYHYSTVISHAAYKMWIGLDGIPNSAISTEDMVRLWYTSMLMLPSDADFGDCRTAVTLAAEHMGLTEAQQRGITQAFDEAGVYDQRYAAEVCYLVSEDFTLTVYGDDNEPFGNYRIEVEEDSGPLEIFFGKQVEFVSEEPGEYCMLKLHKSVYEVTLTNLHDPTQTICFNIKVESGGSDSLNLYTSFTRPEETEGTLVPSESQPGEVPEEPDTGAGQVPYQIEKWDRSYSNEAEGWSNQYYYNHVVILGEQPVYEHINRYIREYPYSFMHFYSDDALKEAPINDEGGTEGLNKYLISEVTHNSNDIMSILLTDDDGYYTGITVSLQNGAPLGLYMLAGKDADEFREELKTAALSAYAQCGTAVSYDLQAYLNSHPLEALSFFVQDGRIMLILPESLDNEKDCPVLLPTELEISTRYTDQLKDSFLAPGEEAVADFETLTWDRSSGDLFGARYMCTYWLLQGDSPAYEKINADVYQMVEQFMSYRTDAELSRKYYDPELGTKMSISMNLSALPDIDSKGLISYWLNYTSYMPGEGKTYGDYYVVYSLSTGDRVSLSELGGMNEDVLLVLLKERILYETRDWGKLTKDYKDWLDSYTLDDFAFNVSYSGEVVILLPNGEMIDAENGSYGVHTGIYIH